MNATELTKILDEHKVWVISLRERGSRANLRSANLCDADLRSANLCGADLCGADLRSANLCGADLCDADLRSADLRSANLCGADLCDADLRSANLCDANLCGANLCGANLRSADLRSANLPEHTYVITGHIYAITITNGEYIRAGCQNHTAEDWRKFSKREIADMDGRKALKFYPRLLDIIDFYFSVGARPEWLKKPESEE
ncbi:pentapeptide repeat-containing protein [Rahnella sp. PCH160]|uniref:pentapeptide repeat-containing protein n=1 Tax=Rahnella sp. PCH160 TaxID=3447928 RepID=UPI0039FDD39E